MVCLDSRQLLAPYCQAGTLLVKNIVNLTTQLFGYYIDSPQSEVIHRFRIRASKPYQVTGSFLPVSNTLLTATIRKYRMEKVTQLVLRHQREQQATPARSYDKGMGEAVANRTINRKIDRPTERQQVIRIPRRDDMALDAEVASYCKSNHLKIDGYHVDKGDGDAVAITLNVIADVEVEKWADVANRVSLGNALLIPKDSPNYLSTLNTEYTKMHHHMRQASLIMSGRHLQHGDVSQPTRNMEVFTNCSTSAMSFLGFYLLLNGSGVGRCYDDALMQVDWRLMPIVACVIDGTHPDVQSGEIKTMSRRDAEHLYMGSRKVFAFTVPDSREGWAQAIEKLEVMTFAGCYKHAVLLLDFSEVRHRGSPIGGMQDRPASGPGPLMTAIENVAKLRDSGMAPWRATMYADHYFAECVLVGGARRAARMATKFWTDSTIFDFIELKRGGFLWSSNNSVMVDEEFWELVKMAEPDHRLGRWEHAHKVFNQLCYAAYHDQTGEPGIITVSKLTWNGENTDILLDGDFAESAKYKLMPDTLSLTRTLVHAWNQQKYKVITNPCGEIVLSAVGGYCVLASVVPYHAGLAVTAPNFTISADVKRYFDEVDADAEDAFKVATRSLIRTNLMDSMYGKEVRRTNRIGVALVGLHEYAWSRFQYGWKELVKETTSMDFWQMLSRFKRVIQTEAARYATELGVTIPHTDATMVPAGTISKLFGLTEGAHLPAMKEFLRWVQFANGDPLIEVYRAKGYPVKALQIYKGMTIVGFPTQPLICSLGMGDKLVTAAEATPEEQYAFLQLLEKYWIIGVAEDGVTPLRDTGNQVSYTLKYDPKVVSFEDFKRTLLDGQSTIRCCSVMPQTDTSASAYEYLPEQPVTKAEYEQIAAAIEADDSVQEDVGKEHVDCANGACPISFGQNIAA